MYRIIRWQDILHQEMQTRKRNNGNILVGWFVVYCTFIRQVECQKRGKREKRLVGDVEMPLPCKYKTSLFFP